ncbi:transcriptional regulator, XRE family [Azoarcus sp. CIB]|uniref:helix-turn-helix domain-containing protein n=1 Tax=Aromatoleum sp. (strain CIB) TaxID=198107 RepID=UPI00067C3316|nr:helix-turn-helix transcriptional regulator [Azoarcus sp. CIB]AKU11298.1 transcriptional regulator, XRE family [Azoarcus sp. CIB]
MNRLEALSCAIREARLAAGLSQERLAEVAHVHRNLVGLLERNERNPTVGSLLAIADGLGVPASKLLARAEVLAEDSRRMDEA